jgi:putative ABC transport system permease protein
MATLIQDLRYAFRVLRKSPGFTAIAIFTLALGIGANVAIFSYVDELWLRPMPVPHADRLVRIYTSSPSSHGEIELGENSYPDFEALRAAKSLAGVAVLERRGAMYDDGSQNRLLSAAVLSDNFFDVMQPSSAHGRTFTEAELRNGDARPIVISYPFWRRAFNSDSGIVGRSIVLSRQAVTVYGILPRGFRGTESDMVPDVWIPFTTWWQISAGDRARKTDRSFRDLEMFGKLREGATLQQARAELTGIAGQLAQAYPQSNANRKMTALYERDTRGDETAREGLVLLSVAGLVLLIAAANVAGLVIARIEYRRREITTRLALGAGRGRIVRQLLTETMILAIGGGTAALMLGDVVLQAIPSLMPRTSIPAGVDAYVSSRTLVAAVAAVAVSLLIFALAPAWLATRLNPVSGLRQRGAESGGTRGFSRNALVVVQVALSLVLVVSAGLLVRSLWKGLKLDPGFNAHQRMLVIDFGPDMRTQAEDVRLVQELRSRMEALPAVTGTTAALRVPFGLSGSGMTHKVFVARSLGSDREGATINYAPVADRYFEVLGTRILRGRPIERHDLELEARVAVVNQQMAARFWPDQDPIGKTMRLDQPGGEEYEVIGVAENGKYNEIQEDSMPYFFLPMKPYDYGETEMAISTNSDPRTLAVSFRQALRGLNPNAAILEMVTMREHMRQALYVQQVDSRLITALGLLGLVLVAVGLYGLMSFVVGKRTQEIGVRLALGSQRSAIFKLMVRYAVRLTVIGVILGTAGAIMAGHYLRTLLVGVAPLDPLVFTISIAVLLAITFAAALVPAMNAIRVDPVVALRDE